MANNIIKGRKGGGSKQRTPTEQPDDLQSVAKAKILLALGEGEFAGGLNAVAKQIDERGNEFGFHGAKYLFHTSDAVLAQNLINPSGTVNVQYRTVSDLIPGMKFGGIYNNSTDANDWVLITEGHKIQRIIKAGYEILDEINDNHIKKLYSIIDDWQILQREVVPIYN